MPKRTKLKKRTPAVPRRLHPPPVPEEILDMPLEIVFREELHPPPPKKPPAPLDSTES